MSTTIATIRMRIVEFVSPKGWFHLARGIFESTRAKPAHTHDFPEVFWVIDGSGTHHVNDGRQPLNRGDVVLVRPTDRHTFSASRRGSMSIMNLAFRDETRQFLHQRYFAGDRKWVWGDDLLSSHHALPLAAFAELQAAADLLSRSSQSRLALETFLLQLLSGLVDNVGPADTTKPPWLVKAIGDMDDGERLRAGPGAMAQACDQSIEHLNRVVRRHFNCTTTQFINQLRVDRAARLLRMTDKPITEVAYEAGFENLGYFYRRFTQRFSRTPKQFRQQARSVMQ